MVLSCPLPEEQNTRGRRIYPPEESAIGFGILTLKEIPKVIISYNSAFPSFQLISHTYVLFIREIYNF